MVPRVDLTTTGHSLAKVLGYASGSSWVLSGGQVLLVGGAKIFELHWKICPVATWNVPIPADCALVGLRGCTQAVHLQGQGPFALSNAQDLTFGY